MEKTRHKMFEIDTLGLKDNEGGYADFRMEFNWPLLELPATTISQKAFISMPMKGMGNEELRAVILELAKKVHIQGYRPLDTLLNGHTLKECMADSFTILLKEADVLVMAPGWEESRGCVAEFVVAKMYDIPVYRI